MNQQGARSRVLDRPSCLHVDVDDQELHRVFEKVVEAYLSGPHSDAFVQRAYSDNPHRFLTVALRMQSRSARD